MLEEFRRDVFIDPVVLRQFQRDAQQVQAIHRHPARAVGLVDVAAGRQRRAAVEHADVVEAKEAALENIASLRVLAIHPPGEVEQQLVKDAFEKFQVALVVRIGFAALLAVHLEHAPGRPGMDGRVHVAESPLVSGQLAVRVHIPFAREQRELVLGELGVHHRQRDAMKRQIPRGIPRILPFVGHGHDAGVVEMRPSSLRPCLRSAGGGGWAGSPMQPFAHVVVVDIACSRSSRRTPAAGRCARRHRRCRPATRRKIHRPPGCAAAKTESKSENGFAACWTLQRRSRICFEPPAGIVEFVQHAGLGAGYCGFTAA